MDYKAFLIKYAEIGTKGRNRYVFEDVLCKQINEHLAGLLIQYIPPPLAGQEKRGKDVSDAK